MDTNSFTPMEEFLNWGNRLANSLAGEMANFERSVHRIPVDLYETRDDVIVEASLPGFRPETVQLEYDKDCLVIRAERPLPTSGVRWLRAESPYGSFIRTIQLGSDVLADQAAATWSEGVLRIRLPKAEVARPKAIPIQVEGEKALSGSVAS